MIRGGREIISNVVASQIHLHERYGGVVPELASRAHITSLAPVITDALAPLGGDWNAINAVACTYGPGLASALLTGVNAAKALAWSHGKPLVAVNHLEGHIYANWLVPVVNPAPDVAAPPAPHPEFPAVALVVSGGHTALVLLRDYGDYQLLGQTRDDAAGEAFDKAARIMGLGYPGGPRIQKLAPAAPLPNPFTVPRAWLGDSYDFSFSGVKTHVLHAVTRRIGPGAATTLLDADPTAAAQLAAAFQESVVDVLVTKTVQAAQEHGARCILLAGGVAANAVLRDTLRAQAAVPVLAPPLGLCTDNAAMIGAAAFYRYAAGLQTDWSLNVVPNLRLVPHTTPFRRGDEKRP